MNGRRMTEMRENTQRFFDVQAFPIVEMNQRRMTVGDGQGRQRLTRRMNEGADQRNEF